MQTLYFGIFKNTCTLAKHTIYSIEYYGQEKLVLMQSTSIHSV